MYTLATTEVNGEKFTGIGECPCDTLMDLMQKLSVSIGLGAAEHQEALKNLCVTTVYEDPESVHGISATKFIVATMPGRVDF